MPNFKRGDVVIFLSNIPRSYDDIKHCIIRCTGETDPHIIDSDDPNVSLLKNAVHAAIATDENHIIEVTGGNKDNPACISNNEVNDNYYPNRPLTYVLLRRNDPEIAEGIACTAERWLKQNIEFSAKDKIHYSIPTCFEAEINELIQPIIHPKPGDIQRDARLIKMLEKPGSLFLMQKGFICSQLVADACLVAEFQKSDKSAADFVSDQKLREVSSREVNYSAITPCELSYQLQCKPEAWQVVQPAICLGNLKSEIQWYRRIRESEPQCHGLAFFNARYQMKESKLSAAQQLAEMDGSMYAEMTDEYKRAVYQGRLGAIHNRYSTLFQSSISSHHLDTTGLSPAYT